MPDSAGSSRPYLFTMVNNMNVDGQRNVRVRHAYAEAQRQTESGRVEEQTPERIVEAQLELEAMERLALYWGEMSEAREQGSRRALPFLGRHASRHR